MSHEDITSASRQLPNSFEQPPFQLEEPPQYLSYESSGIPLAEDLFPVDLTPANDVGMPLQPENASRKAFKLKEETHLSTEGKIVIGVYALLATFYAGLGTVNVLADKPYYGLNFATAAMWGIAGVINSRNPSFHKRK